MGNAMLRPCTRAQRRIHAQNYQNAQEKCYSARMPEQQTRALDETDRHLVALVMQDARRAAAEMATIVNLSATAVGRRLKRLEESGVIIKYSAQVDFAKLGYGVEALIDVRFTGNTGPEAATKAVAQIPDVVSVFMTSGDYDLVALVRVESIDHLRDLLGALRTMPHVIGTRTHVVLDSYQRQASVEWNARSSGFDM